MAPSSDSSNAETSRTTPCTKPPHPASYSTTPPPPPTSALAPASIPLVPLPNLCLPTSSIPPASSYHFTHRYAHALSPLSLSSASIAPLAAAPTAPAISWLSEPLTPTCKAGKTLLLNASKLSTMAVPYLLGFRWGDRYIRIPLTGNGISLDYGLHDAIG